ncbi:capsular biosynthesis protein [Photobacterium leiognathi]|uniref:capsular biosynthesis protein n=1 Tax=Photobacterium leiognathi TaxID=553611 RepID=UPI00273751EA|nr:capsular biosynthesis protein [Photobacterium leiognathi]
MFLIMSAAYVDIELQSEFGALPPSLLPLGNRRLFQHQSSLIPTSMDKFISLPESYQLSVMDTAWLKKNNFTILATPDGLSLGASLVAALSLIDKNFTCPLHVLFGDTLIGELPNGNDIITLAEVEDSYNWATINNQSNSRWLSDSINPLATNEQVVCGYFKFSQPRQLIRCITQSHWDFLKGLNRYHEKIGLHPIKISQWLDFGHVNTYYRSKAKFTTQRAFNELVITPEWIEKSSSKNTKIKAEANWFDNLPTEMRNYIPQFMGTKEEKGQFKYRLEYLHHTALNELYVFSELPPLVWKKIFSSCIKFIESCKTFSAPIESVHSPLTQLFGEKTLSRLNEFCQERNIDIDDIWYIDGQCISLAEVIEVSSQWLPTEPTLPTVMHGDFCFSNILYDFRTHRVKTIDPRGLTHHGELTIYGDTRYDIAKLSHSVLGMYDWIIAGYYEVIIKDNHIQLNISGQQKRQDIQQLFIEIVEKNFGLSPMQLYAMQIQLFLSMLPLHDDDKERQDALFANAFRLYLILKGYIQ